MVKRILTKSYGISYPVYKNMDANYHEIYDMATEFFNSISGEVIGKELNLFFTGSSGCIISTIFFTASKSIKNLGKVNMVLIRKKGEKSHDVISAKPKYGESIVNIFVDDHIFDGDTLFTCHKTLSKEKKDFIFDYVIITWLRGRALDRITKSNITNNIFIEGPCRVVNTILELCGYPGKSIYQFATKELLSVTDNDKKFIIINYQFAAEKIINGKRDGLRYKKEDADGKWFNSNYRYGIFTHLNKKKYYQ